MDIDRSLRKLGINHHHLGAACLCHEKVKTETDQCMVHKIRLTSKFQALQRFMLESLQADDLMD